MRQFSINPVNSEGEKSLTHLFDEDSESVSDLKPSIQPEPRATTTTMAANGLKTPCKTPVPKAGFVMFFYRLSPVNYNDLNYFKRKAI
jgi:hypothetical protein